MTFDVELKGDGLSQQDTVFTATVDSNGQVDCSTNLTEPKSLSDLTAKRTRGGASFAKGIAGNFGLCYERAITTSSKSGRQSTHSAIPLQTRRNETDAVFYDFMVVCPDGITLGPDCGDVAGTTPVPHPVAVPAPPSPSAVNHPVSLQPTPVPVPIVPPPPPRAPIPPVQSPPRAVEYTPHLFKPPVPTPLPPTSPSLPSPAPVQPPAPSLSRPSPPEPQRSSTPVPQGSSPPPPSMVPGEAEEDKECEILGLACQWFILAAAGAGAVLVGACLAVAVVARKKGWVPGERATDNRASSGRTHNANPLEPHPAQQAPLDDQFEAGEPVHEESENWQDWLRMDDEWMTGWEADPSGEPSVPDLSPSPEG
eukprot:gene3128-3666_t